MGAEEQLSEVEQEKTVIIRHTACDCLRIYDASTSTYPINASYLFCPGLYIALPEQV